MPSQTVRQDKHRQYVHGKYGIKIRITKGYLSLVHDEKVLKSNPQSNSVSSPDACEKSKSKSVKLGGVFSNCEKSQEGVSEREALSTSSGNSRGMSSVREIVGKSKGESRKD